MKSQSKLVNFFIVGVFTLLYLFVSIISMVHTVEFFKLSNPYDILAISLAIAFELGAAASLATVVTQDAMNKFIVWGLFIILTLFQMMGNTYYAYHNLTDFKDWAELFALNDLSDIEQKRYLAIISGAILPVVALGYIKCLVDYLKSKKTNNDAVVHDCSKDEGTNGAEAIVDDNSVKESSDDIGESNEIPEKNDEKSLLDDLRNKIEADDSDEDEDRVVPGQIFIDGNTDIKKKEPQFLRKRNVKKNEK